MGSGHWAWGIGDWAAGERANDLSASARDQRERCHRVTAGRGGDTHAARRPRGRWCTPPTALLDQRRCVRVVEGLSGVLTGACASWRSLQTHAPHGADATLIPPRRPKHSRQQAVPETVGSTAVAAVGGTRDAHATRTSRGGRTRTLHCPLERGGQGGSGKAIIPTFLSGVRWVGRTHASCTDTVYASLCSSARNVRGEFQQLSSIDATDHETNGGKGDVRGRARTGESRWCGGGLGRRE